MTGGNRRRAFRHFRKASQLTGTNWNLQEFLDEVDPRGAPVIGFLPRNNFLNVFLGRIRKFFLQPFSNS
jgi:hypothetical protein